MTEKRCDLIYKIIIALGLEYLLFFSLESILPGLIVKVFNINILLVLVVGLIAILLLNKKHCFGSFVLKKADSIQRKTKNNLLLKYLIGGTLLFLILIIVIVLHKVTFWLALIYLVSILFISGVLWFFL